LPVRTPANESGPIDLRIVEIELHRRMPFRGKEQIREAPGDVRADGLALECADELSCLRLLNGDNEMIDPKPHQPFAERCVRDEAMAETGCHLLQKP
jgi:hypothetical protein